jgi:hypothetical protein
MTGVLVREKEEGDLSPRGVGSRRTHVVAKAGLASEVQLLPAAMRREAWNRFSLTASRRNRFW